jgi:hypothetical protein
MQENSKLHNDAVAIVSGALKGDRLCLGILRCLGISNIRSEDVVNEFEVSVIRLCNTVRLSTANCLDFSKLSNNNEEGLIFREATKIVLSNLSHEIRSKIYQTQKSQVKNISVLPALESLINEIDHQDLSCSGMIDQQP